MPLKKADWKNHAGREQAHVKCNKCTNFIRDCKRIKVSDGRSREIYLLSDEKAIGLSNTTLWKKGKRYIFNDGPVKGWSVGLKFGPYYISLITSGSQELPRNKTGWKHLFKPQPIHVECMKVCNDLTTIQPKEPNQDNNDQKKNPGVYTIKCGAALLNRNWVITAGHCLDGSSTFDILVRMGDHDTKANNEPMPHVDRSVKSIVFHPQFSRTAFNMIGYDVALLKLNTPVDFAANLIPICLPENDNQLVDEIAWTQGFGALYEGGPSPTVLHEVSVPIISNEECYEWFSSDAGYSNRTVPNTMMCAGYKEGGKDTCQVSFFFTMKS